jgi:uroporphyrinogen-III synthase
MRVLVTRPRPDADETAAELMALGHEPVVAPLLEVTLDSGVALDVAGVQAILITSANGARAMASAISQRDLPVLAVGAASAAAARKCGFAQTESADGDVETLAGLVMARLTPQGGALVHVVGTVTAGDLSGRLADSGFDVRRAVLYQADLVAELPEETERRLREDTLDAVLFYSPRTAAQFTALVAAKGLAGHCSGIIALALSDAVVEKLSGLAFADIRIAETPDQDSLFRALGMTST